MMNTKQFLDKVARANSLPLNLEAKKRLREAKAPVYEESLYVLQLAQWGLDNGITPEKPSRSVLESNLQDLTEVDPEKAMRYLLFGAEPPGFPEEEEYPPLTAESLSGSPEQAAVNVLSLLANWLFFDPRLNDLGLV